MDWQYPENGTQWKWYSKLIVELGNKLKADNKILTATLRPNACSLSKKARTALEYVNLMTYDMFDERGEHSSNYETCMKIETPPKPLAKAYVTLSRIIA